MLPARRRALSLALAGKGELRRWDEPDKYYTGRIYDPADIERMAQGAMRFSISFVCEPFAYGAQKTLAFAGSTDVEYAGSARTPVRMVIRNDNDFAITGIVITATERAE